MHVAGSCHWCQGALEVVGGEPWGRGGVIEEQVRLLVSVAALGKLRLLGEAARGALTALSGDS